MKNLTELELQIVHYNAQYRAGYPEISDSTYDSIVERLKKEQPESVLLKRAIIEKAKESRKTKLPFPMMSLEKEKVFDNVKKWAYEISGGLDVELIITPKFDGISILSKENTFLTRGDGFVGQECSQHCNFISKQNYLRRGELIITKKTWKQNDIFRKYKHPRNVVAGWINGDYDETIPYNLMSYFTYDMPDSNLLKSEQLEILNRDNRNQVPFLITSVNNLQESTLHSVFKTFKKLYPVDGLVIEFNDPKYRVGTLPNGNPRFAIAYKHSSFSDIGQGVIKEIEMSVNRYGVVTPTVVLEESINLSGAEISRVNGINMRYIYDWLLYPSQEIEIVRSGEVIPKIISVGGIEIPFAENFITTKEYNEAYKINQNKRESMDFDISLSQDFSDSHILCPYCESILKWDVNITNQVCDNNECPERKLQQIVDFFRIFEVENVAEGTLRILYEKGFDTVKEILDITEEELLQIDGFAEKSSRDFVSAMKVLKEKGGPLAKHMHASGYFPNLGEKTLQLIIDSREDGDVFSKAELLKVNGIGEKTAEIFLNGLPYFLNRGRWGIFVTYVETPKREKKEGIFSGNTLCFTGCRPTPELRQRLENAGAEIVENFTSKVTYLVTKDINSTSSKIEKARKSGVIIVSLKDLIKNQ